MKHIGMSTIDKYLVGEYVLEVEQIIDKKVGLMWNFYVTEDRSIHRTFMFGIPANQSGRELTEGEAINIAIGVFDGYVNDYRDELEKLGYEEV